MSATNHTELKRRAEGFKGDTPQERLVNSARGKHRQFYEGEERRAKVLVLVSQGVQVKQAVSQVGVSYGTYEKWRTRFRAWASELDAARARWHSEVGPQTHLEAPKTGFDMANLRVKWFGHVSPPFQVEMWTAMRDIRPGNILMVLLPPEHGKTTTYEDFKTLDLAHNPSQRNHVGSESQTLSMKILARIKNRLSGHPGSPFLKFVETYGPFSPQKGDTQAQPWAATHFDVYGKAQHDERDYSMAALGFDSQIIGSRSDHLHGDDLQSMKTLSQTEKYVDRFTQDWLTRPGEDGFTTIFGNRVDENDIYEALEEAIDPDILSIIRYPAILNDGTPLWPEKWDLEKLDRMRRKVGEARFERNWMQRPRSKLFATFTQHMLDECRNPHLSLEKPLRSDGKFVILTLDPAIGGRNAIMGIQITDAGRIRPVLIEDETNLRSNEAIMVRLRAAALKLQAMGFTILEIVIEAKNFQAGLARDERLRELTDFLGCPAREHLTGWNKYDENIGVASMVTTFIKHEIELPWAADEMTRTLVGQLESQLLRWKPMERGNRLRQDLVMALWFGWIRWRRLSKSPDNAVEQAKTDSFRFQGLPYGAMENGLILPKGYNPTILGGYR